MTRPRKACIRVSVLTAFATTCFVSETARADFYIHHWETQSEKPQTLRVGADLHYYTAPQNFDGSGAPFNPASLLGANRIVTDLSVAYGLPAGLTAYARLAWGRTEITLDSGGGNTFGFADQSIGLAMRLFEGKTGKANGMTLDLQGQVDFPFYSNVTLIAGAPSLGDGSKDMTGGGFITYPMQTRSGGTFALIGGAGFTYRTDGFSMSIPWSVVARLTPKTEGFFGSFSVLGTTSLQTDSRSNQTFTSSLAVSNQTGGSYISNALNPSLVTLRGEAGYQFGSEISGRFFLSRAIYGISAPLGLDGGFALQFRLGSAPAKLGGKISPVHATGSNSGFINYSLEARVTRINDHLGLVKIDKGSQDGVEMGQVFDVFRVKKDGNIGEPIARGRVSGVQANESALNIEEYYKEVWIDEGFVAKRQVQ